LEGKCIDKTLMKSTEKSFENNGSEKILVINSVDVNYMKSVFIH
jgi:hypothetical protein